MTEEPTPVDNTPPPPKVPTPAPTQQAPAEPTYSMDELAAEAASFGCYQWDVKGIFATKGVETMTEDEFRAALEEWRTPLPVSTPEGSN